jgi:hypothetical protein
VAPLRLLNFKAAGKRRHAIGGWRKKPMSEESRKLLIVEEDDIERLQIIRSHNPLARLMARDRVAAEAATGKSGL